MDCKLIANIVYILLTDFYIQVITVCVNITHTVWYILTRGGGCLLDRGGGGCSIIGLRLFAVAGCLTTFELGGNGWEGWEGGERRHAGADCPAAPWLRLWDGALSAGQLLLCNERTATALKRELSAREPGSQAWRNNQSEPLTAEWVWHEKSIILVRRQLQSSVLRLLIKIKHNIFITKSINIAVIFSLIVYMKWTGMCGNAIYMYAYTRH